MAIAFEALNSFGRPRDASAIALGLMGVRGWRLCSYAAMISVVFAVSAHAAKLGGPYYVDDAEIGKVGSCEVESWASLAADADHSYVFGPACVVKLGLPVEIGINAVNTLSGGAADTTLSLTGKVVPLPIGPNGGFGLAVSTAAVYDVTQKTLNSFIFEMPLPYEVNQALRINVDVGSQYNSLDPRGMFVRAGTGVPGNSRNVGVFVPKYSP